MNVTQSHATRLVYREAGHASLENLEAVAVDPLSMDVKVQALYSGISRGTESLVFGGKVPVSEWDRMRCPHQVGDFSFPLSYGYSIVGKVIGIGNKVKTVSPGDLVFVLHPHQDFFVVDESWVNPLPKGLSAERAVLSANAETALNAVWDADLTENGSVLIVGGGAVGLLTGYIAMKTKKIRPCVFDIDMGKRAVAEALGLEFVSSDDLMGREFSAVFHTSATSEGLQTAIDHTMFEGLIVEMSWYGDKPVELSLGGSFHSKRLMIRSSQVGHVATKYRDHISPSQRIEKAMSLLDDVVLDRLLSPRILFDNLPQHLEQIYNSSDTVLCPLVEYK